MIQKHNKKDSSCTLNSMNRLYVRKRSGKTERCSFDKITNRIDRLCWGLDTEYIDSCAIAQETIKGLYPGISTEELDFYSAQICADMIPTHPDFNKLAARITVSNLTKTTDADFFTVVGKLYNNMDRHGKRSPLVSEELYNIANKHRDAIQSKIDYNRDYYFDFFGIMTLMRSYLKRLRNSSQIATLREFIKDKDELDRLSKLGAIVERPQHMWMRVALGIHREDLESAFETYDLMSKKFFTHATPTLFNSGTPFPQLSSCFLLTVGDNMESIADVWKQMVLISKRAGGLGLDASRIRASNSIIRTTNGLSKGLVPLCQAYQMAVKYADQGGKRKGSLAIYIEVWHADIEPFLELKTKQGDENQKALDIFTALWVCDLFMKRVKEDGMWSLMCPDECPGLTEVYGEEFEKLYTEYEDKKMYREQIPAKKLFMHILATQTETGTPYIAFKDTANRCSNQKNIGIIRSSNLCMEIFEHTNEDEIAVCNLASLCLPKFIEKDEERNNYFNHEKLHHVTKIATRNLNKIIDINYYPVKETRNSNLKHRPIGVGIQGLADVFAIMKLPFDSKEAVDLNQQIAETIYHACLEASCELAENLGPYDTFEGSPFSEGKFQFDLHGMKEEALLGDWDWNTLRERVMKYGTRNSLLTAYMPTASTAQIMGNNESFEPYTKNLYNRKTLAGEYTILNRHLVEDLISEKLWNERMRDKLIYYEGSIKYIEEIPDWIKKIYQTAFDMKQKIIIDQAVARSRFIDQSQSMNLFMAEPDFSKLMSAHLYSWSKGLKTGVYYLHGRPRRSAVKAGINPELLKELKRQDPRRNVYIDSVSVTNSEVANSTERKQIGDVSDSDSDDDYIPTREELEMCEACT